MESNRIKLILDILQRVTKPLQDPMTVQIKKEFGDDPFLILISCLLSLRARDVMTFQVSKELFARAKTPEQIVSLSERTLSHIFKPIGFYHRKARIVRDVCADLLARFGGKVPQTEFELLSIKGVGPKTAALVLAEGFGIPALCVDTHVHKVSNRLGIVNTKTPEQTQKALMRIIPKKYWIKFNRLLVIWGQNICVPISPKCSQCALFSLCDRVGVKKSR